MFRIYACIVDQHDLRLLGLAVLVCLLGSISAIGLFSRAHQAERGQMLWITAAALVTGGSIWATHFVAMLAFDPAHGLAIDFSLTVASLSLAVLVTWVGIALVVLQRLGTIGGGIIVGAAIGIMHYTGMQALVASTPVFYDPLYLLLPLLIGVGLSGLTFFVAGDGGAPVRRGIAAFLLAGAICGLHFTSMAAVELPAIAAPAGAQDREWLAFYVAIVVILVLALGIAGAIFDQLLASRAIAEAHRLRAHVLELEATQQRLRQTAEELTIARDAAEAANLAKSQFLATMSHELRTPLNAVIGFSELITTEAFGPLKNERYREYAHDIHSSGIHLLDLINDILDLAKLDVGTVKLRLEDVQIAPLADKVIRVLGAQADAAGQTVELDIPQELPNLRADPIRLQQILLNLVGNAIKFTPKCGKICLAARASASEVEILVSDNGIGMKPEDIPKALERFGQVDNSLARRYEGSGLGLPIAKRLTEAQNGHLAIISEPGRGTTVTVALPIAA